jgi:isoleucyl-tRNA synthetase
LFKRPKSGIFGPSKEEEILKFWNENKIFEKSVESRKGAPLFRFLEGPPTANGLPHPGHIRTRTIKDVVLRYKTMLGYYVPRSAGWDTHGLPVELEVQAELGLKSKEEIERYGIERFGEACKANVFKYEREWRRMTERIGFWLDLEHAYITFKNEYIESIWWSLKNLYERGLLYKGFKVVPYCPKDGTPLSSHEVAQGYEETEDPSIYVKFRLLNGIHDGKKLVAWTTTPWTLPSNIALAVKPDAEYVSFKYQDDVLICAKQRVKVFGDVQILQSFSGSELIGSSYEPPFDYAKKVEGKKYVVVGYEGVSLEEGTGVVHMAPAFGEEDYEVCKANSLAFFQPVDSNGKFTSEVSEFKGLFVKDADPLIIRYLKERNLLVKSERYKHNYPFCWRCGSPLLYYAWPTWFVKTTARKEKIIELNSSIAWFPEHIREGRFGDFLREMVDWALSRNRYWGTPLPVWVCSNCGEIEVIGSVQELLQKSVKKPERLELHRPYVDEFVLRCNKCGGEMRREPVVIDVWYDSGAATFARYHYPFENREQFENNFPVDFITEGVDQTRGWFYSLHVLGSLLFDQVAFKSCLVIGLVLNEQGEKMSKSKKNYDDPWTLIEKYGADALRWQLLGTTPWDVVRFGERGVADAKRRFFGILENCVTFFLTYAELDGFDPALHTVEFEKTSTLDKWLLSKLQLLIKGVRQALDVYEFNAAVELIEKFVVDDLSQWYIRRSRRRFWKEEKDLDKWAAYTTLYHTLLELSKIIAPLAPFSAEVMYQELALKQKMPESVHLNSYPQYNPELVFEKELEEIEDVRNVVEVIRAARNEGGVKTRQPLLVAKVYCQDRVWKSVEKNYEVVVDEVNVKKVERLPNLSEYRVYDLIPNKAAIGKRFKVKSVVLIEKANQEKQRIAQEIAEKGYALVELDGEKERVTEEEFRVVLKPKEGFAHAERSGIHVFLDLRTTPELEEEGLVRDFVRRVQIGRKELNLEFDQKIKLRVWFEDERLSKAVLKHEEYVKSETLASEVAFDPSVVQQVEPVDLDGSKVWIKIEINPL